MLKVTVMQRLHLMLQIEEHKWLKFSIRLHIKSRNNLKTEHDSNVSSPRDIYQTVLKEKPDCLLSHLPALNLLRVEVETLHKKQPGVITAAAWFQTLTLSLKAACYRNALYTYESETWATSAFHVFDTEHVHIYNISSSLFKRSLLFKLAFFCTQTLLHPAVGECRYADVSCDSAFFF